jgi:hypothetical protein
MASVARSDLKVAYELGSFIVSQVPCLNEIQGDPWAHLRFREGPNPYHNQLKEGLLLVVDNLRHCPYKLYTRYGEWKIFGSRIGSFKKVFEVVQEKLNLRKVEELSNEDESYWAVENWNGQILDKPILADEDAGEYIPYEVAKEELASIFKK